MEQGSRSAILAVELKNNPAPYVPPFIQNELTKLGGTVGPGFGRFTGKPRVTLLWGQTTRAFECGKQRIRFVDPKIDPIFEKQAFRITPEGIKQLGKLQRIAAKRREAALKSADWDTYHALLFAPAEYFLKKFIPVKEWARLAIGSSFEETARLLPDGWTYFEDIPTITEIGCPNFYAVQWIPGPQIDEKWNWQMNRFGQNPLMEFGGDERFVDIIGPYPQYGEYWNILLKIEAENGGYAQPDEHNCLDPIRKMFAEARKAKPKSKTETIEDRLVTTVHNQQLASAARTRRTIDTLMAEANIVRHGKSKNVRIFPKDRSIKRKPSYTKKA
jgi:hypothetical protein